MSAQIQRVVEEERKQAAEDRLQLLSQISGLINAQADLRESRLAAKAGFIRDRVLESRQEFEDDLAGYSKGMEVWAENEDRLVTDVASSRDALKTKLKDDWTVSVSLLLLPLLWRPQSALLT